MFSTWRQKMKSCVANTNSAQLSAEYAEIEQFYASAPPVAGYEAMKASIESFVADNMKKGRRIALVSSGGTTVPLEKNTVRYLDNFSGGRRGASSTEYFLAEGYAVIFLHRKHSLQPFSRRFLIHHDSDFLSFLQVAESGVVEVSSGNQEWVKSAIKAASQAQETGCLLQIPFVTLYEYLVLLRCASNSVKVAGRNAMIFAAAAVSDFYLSADKVAEHKIQSSAGPLELQFACVPKMLRALKQLWCPDAFVVTFKLETDPALLTRKAMVHLAPIPAGYGIQAVVGNLLAEHKDKVTLFTALQQPVSLSRTEEEKTKDEDLERQLIPVVTSLHTQFLGLANN